MVAVVIVRILNPGFLFSYLLNMPQFHPYRNGYSVLPQLNRIAVHQVFHSNSELRNDCRVAKQEAMVTQQVCFSQCLGVRVETEIANWIRQHYPIPLAGEKLEELAPQMSEDVVVHSLDEESDAMTFGHICFPSGWDPSHAIGRSFEQIHQPVPGMNLKNSRKLVETIVHHGPFERFVWSVIFDKEINGHPTRSRKLFSLDYPIVFVKVERQVTVPFPDHSCVLFLLQQSLIKSDEIDKLALARAIQDMSVEELRYKNLGDCRDELAHWLESSAG